MESDKVEELNEEFIFEVIDAISVSMLLIVAVTFKCV